jgi:hypothetical protein
MRLKENSWRDMGPLMGYVLGTIDVALCDIDAVRLHCVCSGTQFAVELRVYHRGEQYEVARDCTRINGCEMEEASIAYRDASTGQYEAGYLGRRTAHNSFKAACKAAVAAANERRKILEAAIASAKAVRDYAAALAGD